MEEFKRKTIEEICIGIPNEYIEASRLAPSVLNLQPWKLIVEDNVIHVYCRKTIKILDSMLSKLYRISIGIMLCHIFETSKKKNQKIEFDKKEEIQEIENFEYIISINM